MKNNKLQQTIEALNDVQLQTPQHQSVLKQALLDYRQPPVTIGTKLRAASKNLIGAPMAHKKLFISVSSVALVAVLAISITLYSYGHTPRAEAEALISHGMGLIRTADSGQLSEIQSRLGGDPTEALEEAKAAKDLKVISKDEYEAEAKQHRGIAMSSLGTDGPQFGSIGISANGNLPTTPPDGAEVHYSTGGMISGTTEKGTARIVNGTPAPGSGVGVGDSGPVTVEGPGLSAAGAPPEAGQTMEFHSANAGPAINSQPGPGMVKPITPSKYLRYTDKTGHVVVLGLDDKGIPVIKTIFMNDSDLPQAR